MAHLTKSKKMIAFCLFVGLIVMLFVGCQPRQQDETSSEETGRQMTAQIVDGESDCSLCHNAEEHSKTNTATLAGLHAVSASCVDCHSFNSALQEEHINVSAEDRAPTRLRKTEVFEDTCLNCHGSWNVLKEATISAAALTDANGTTVNPHDLPAGSGHDNLICTDCHGGHKDVTDKKETCISCHHKDVFECNTCHGVS